MVLKKDLKGKGPEEGQTQVATEEELETTGQKRKLRSKTNSQKKAKLETSVSVNASSPDNSTTHGEKNITTPISRLRRATAGKANPTKAVSGDIPVPVTPDQTQAEAIRTSSDQVSSSSKEQGQRKLLDDSEAQAEILESAIQVTTFARKLKGQKRLSNSSREIVETASTSSPSISTNLKDLPASTAVSASTQSKQRGQKAPNASQDRTDETSTTIPSSSNSKKRGRKSAIDKETSNTEGADNSTPSSSRTIRGRRKAQEGQQSQTAIVPEGAMGPPSSSPKKGDRRKKSIDVNELPNEEVAEPDIDLVPLSTKKRGRPKKDAVPVVKQPKPIRERTKKAPKKSANGIKWQIESSSSQKMATDQNWPESVLSTQRPRIWTQDWDDLIAMLPEFAGSRYVNGLTWVMYETPMLLLDDSNTFMEIDWRDKNAHTFDLVTTRSFTCPVPSEEQVLNGSSHGYQDALYVIKDEVNNEMNVHVDFPSTTIERNTTPSVPRIDITADDSANKPPHPNIPGMVTNGPHSPAENERSTVERQKEGVPTYRVITPSYTPAQDPFVKKEETLYRFDNVPTIDTEATADRILDDASRLCGLQITTGMPAQDADAMDIIHSPESPTVPSLPAVPNGVPYSTSNIPALEVQQPQDLSTSIPPPISEPAAPLLQDKFASYVPSPIPDELAAIVDAYVSGTPLTLLMSNDRLATDWSLALPDEFGFILMGYFKILGIQEERLAQEDNLQEKEKKPNLRSLYTGRVRWRITLQWRKGGEKYIFPNSEVETLQRPWWSLALPNSDVPETSEPPAPSNPNSQQELEAEARTTDKYRTARREHSNWEFRHHDYDNIYHGLVPKHLMAPFGADHFDDFFPSGWFCTHCGRLNFQEAMRHRRCKSSFCKDLPSPIKSYSIDLLYLRDPHDRHVVFLPSNSHPGYIQSRREDFTSGLITFSYGTCEAQNSLIKHIFTSNLSEHQEEATKLLKDVQSNVELVRTTDLSDPYFSYSTKGKKLQGDFKSPEAQWLGVPECVNTCRKFINKRLLDFAHLNPGELSIGLLTIVSWITAGVKTIPVPVNAKKHPVSVLCMGCDVVLNITLPASVTVNKPGAGAEEAGEHRLAVMNEDNGEEVEMADPSLGWVADDPETMALLQEQNLISSPRKNQPKLKVGKKILKDTFVLTLVHGDIAVFFGESFECSIKRGGTSLLVIATQN